MMQFVYRDKIYIMGKIDQVTAHLKELSKQFKTVKEYLDIQTREL
jgi:hypothetical protein